MRNLLALLGLLVLVVGGVGWYCGWYKLNITKGQDGSLRIQTDVDTQKAADETSAALHKIGAIVAEKGSQVATPATTPVATPGPVIPVPPTPPALPSNDNGNNSVGSWLFGPSKPATK